MTRYMSKELFETNSINCPNIAKDFSVPVLVIKRTKKGLKVACPVNYTKDQVEYELKFAKDTGNEFMFNLGGSMNSYVIKK